MVYLKVQHSVYLCVCVHVCACVRVCVQLSKFRIFNNIKVIDLIYDLGFHWETSNVLFRNQNSHDVIPAIFEKGYKRPDVSPEPTKCGKIEPREESWKLEHFFKTIQKGALGWLSWLSISCLASVQVIVSGS